MTFPISFREYVQDAEPRVRMVTTDVRSASRVLELLELLARKPGGVSLTGAAEQLGLPKSSTLNLLRTLVGRGYALRDTADRYRLNDFFCKNGFGWGGGVHGRLIALASPIMRMLADKLEETTILGVLTEAGAVQLIAKEVAHQDIRFDTDLDKPLPAYCTAIGRVLLAHLELPAKVAFLRGTPMTKLTSYTITDPKLIDAQLKDARATGIAIVQEEFALGGTGIATIISGGMGKPIAALNVGCITPRFPGKKARVIAELKQSAARLSEALRPGHAA